MGTFCLRDCADHEIAGLLADMKEQGYGTLSNCIPETMLAAARRYVLDELERRSGEYYSCIGRDSVPGSPMAEIGASPALHRLFLQLFEHGTGSPPPAAGIYQVLRVIAGRTGRKQSYRFHYDNYVITALMPIVIPDGPPELRGDLIIYPRSRGIRSSLLVNLAEKLLLQNPLARRMLRSASIQRLLGARELRIEPGHIYFFWGYQSLHGNRPCHASSVRATALFHFVDPHESNALSRVLDALRRRRVMRQPLVQMPQQ